MAAQDVINPKQIKLREFPGVEQGLISHPWSDTGHEWLDQRMDASGVDANVNTHERQRHLAQLGETSWHNDVRMGNRYGPDAPREQPIGDAVTHLYRGMSEAEFQEAKGRGHIKSDQRGVLSEGWEGTNASTNPATAHYYMPRQGTGRVVKMAVLNPHQWFASQNDDYARTREPIPWESVVAHTEEFAHSDAEPRSKTFRDHVLAVQKEQGV